MTPLTSILLESMLRGATPYQEQADLDFCEHFLHTMFKEENALRGVTPYQQQADLVLHEPLLLDLNPLRCTGTGTRIGLRLFAPAPTIGLNGNTAPCIVRDGSLFSADLWVLGECGGIQCGAQGGDVLSTTTSE